MLDVTSAGINTSIIVAVSPNVEINSGIAVTVGAGNRLWLLVCFKSEISDVKLKRVTNLKRKNTGSVGTLPDGAVVTGITTSTSFDGTLNSSNLTGALPALDGSALTSLNIPAGFSELDAALFN